MSSFPAQLEMIVTGKAEIPHIAERALINLSVSCGGPSQASVSESVISKAKHIESLLDALSPQDDTPEAKAAAPLAHWSKTNLSSTSIAPYNSKEPGVPLPRIYKATINFDIRFRDFQALGSFGTRVAGLALLEVKEINWILTEATEKSFRQELRKVAAEDALQKAKDYIAVLGCGRLRAVELTEGDMRSAMAGPRPGGGGGGMMGMYQPPMKYNLQTQPAKKRAPGSGGAGDEGSEDLSFDAQEVKMAMEVTVKFLAGHRTQLA